MTDPAGSNATPAQGITVHYWASARAASGVAEEVFSAPATLADLLAEVVSRHRDRPRLKDVVSVCSVLVGDRPVGTADPASVVLGPGDTVELLPPFAGG